MALERTLAIIKPDIVERHLIGAIISRLEQAQFSIVAMKMVHLINSKLPVSMLNTKVSHFLKI